MTTTVPEPSQSKPLPRPALSNFAVRYLTALVLLPVVLLGVALGGLVWAVMAGIAGVFGALEFYVMAHGRDMQGSALVGVPTVVTVIGAFALDSPTLALVALAICALLTLALEVLRHPRQVRRALWQTATTVAGVLYVGFPLAFLVAIRSSPNGLLWLIIVFAATWGTDTFAYFGGRLFGKTPLAPRLSPKKTVEGAAVGVLGGFLPPLLILSLSGQALSIPLVAALAAAPFVAIAGDLFESAMKRYFDVKDSHVAGLNIIPGHGGVLDRIDALLLVTVFFYAVLQLTQTL